MTTKIIVKEIFLFNTKLCPFLNCYTPRLGFTKNVIVFYQE